MTPFEAHNGHANSPREIIIYCFFTERISFLPFNGNNEESAQNFTTDLDRLIERIAYRLWVVQVLRHNQSLKFNKRNRDYLP